MVLYHFHSFRLDTRDLLAKAGIGINDVQSHNALQILVTFLQVRDMQAQFAKDLQQSPVKAAFPGHHADL